MKTGTKAKLTVGEKTNAGFGDFYPVLTELNGEVFGCDAHIGSGAAPEFGKGATGTKSIEDWDDGNGLLSHDLATEAEVWAAVESR